MDRICDKCDEPATHSARDEVEIPQTLSSFNAFRRYKPYGNWRHGCDSHPVKSKTYNWDDPDYPPDALKETVE